MLIIPAIDIKDGKCVRLFKGDFNQSTIYSENPLEIAKQFYDAGAKLIHIVDLDGAKKGDLVNFSIIEKIKSSINVEIEVGGGIRNIDSIKRLFEHGISRIVLGTSVIENIRFLKTLGDYIEIIIISIDIRNDKLCTHGWLQDTDIACQDFIEQIMAFGAREAIITDISRDGTLEGPNTQLYDDIAQAFRDLNIIVSGGISSPEDIKKIKELRKPNIKGIIIGKAIYEKKIDLKEAIELAK